MSAMQLVTSLLGQAILWVVLLTVPGSRVLYALPRWQLVLPVLVLVLLSVPLHGLTAGEWLKSVVGDPSVLSMLLFADIVGRRVWQFTLLRDETRQWLLRGIVIAGLMLYPLALGLTAFDPYAWGYAPQGLGVMLAAAAIAAWLKGLRNLAVVVLLPLLAWHLQLLESLNLWDYLLDPVIFVYAVLQVWFPHGGNLKKYSI